MNWDLFNFFNNTLTQRPFPQSFVCYWHSYLCAMNLLLSVRCGIEPKNFTNFTELRICICLVFFLLNQEQLSTHFFLVYGVLVI